MRVPLKTRGVLIESTIPSYFVGASLILRRVHFNSETLEISMPGPYKTRTCLARFKWGLQLCEVTILEKTFLLFRMSTLFFKNAGNCFCVNIDSKVGRDMSTYGTHFHCTVCCILIKKNGLRIIYLIKIASKDENLVIQSYFLGMVNNWLTRG